jgi:hypothetical protein
MSANNRLARLPDGTWIRPSWVVSVEAFEAEEGVTGLFPSCVRVYTRGGHTVRIVCNNNDDARALCDWIGRTIADAEDEGDEEEHS